MKLVAIVLTLNESLHLARCLRSVRQVTDAIVVVDAFSDDETVCIAREHGARVEQHAWTGWTSQFNRALDRLDADTEWVLRIDADEYLTPTLAAELRRRLPELGPGVNGVALRRRVVFQGRPIRFGGVSGAPVVRLFRHGRARLESRWMDEHVVGAEPSVTFRGELVDENLRPLTFWTEKHNRYASREAVEMLDLKYRFLARECALVPLPSLIGGTASRRWLKTHVYARLPPGIRAFAWFLYRYVLRLGLLDGRAGAHFHVLQGFWYRYLVDAKVDEVERRMRDGGTDVATAIHEVLGLDVVHHDR